MDLLIQYAMSFIGVPYRWGGSNPITGFDCSGLVQEILKSVYMDPPGDQTAEALYQYFLPQSKPNLFVPGALSFYGKKVDSIVHVGFLIDPYRMIEAGGGGSQTRTREDAALKDAFVRIRPVRQRADFLVTLKPSYMTISQS
jgi:cell wall-associated NlpC family hydrolase